MSSLDDSSDDSSSDEEVSSSEIVGLMNAAKKVGPLSCITCYFSALFHRRDLPHHLFPSLQRYKARIIVFSV